MAAPLTLSDHGIHKISKTNDNMVLIFDETSTVAIERISGKLDASWWIRKELSSGDFVIRTTAGCIPVKKPF